MDTRLIILTGWACPADWLRPLSEAAGHKGDVDLRAVLALRSAKPAAAGLSGYAAGLLELLESGPNGAWVVGWSMGGLVALEACLARPDLFRGLALLAATARFTRAEDSACGVRDATVRVLARHLARDPLATLSRWLKDGARFPPLSEAESVRMAQSSLGSFTTQDLLDGLDYLLHADWRPGLARLRVPSLLLHAREDALVPPAAAENLAAAMPGARFKVYEQADHFFPIRRPVEVAADILAFMGERA
jgi:pimeloyl-[acyl-carrier protein] methyl ester esterase